ncbi:MAG: hypothetical protein RBR38_10325 [Desulfomicrobium apsheronum]|nr:hypothetical protein [Desulfomicrobium apsheronum]
MKTVFAILAVVACCMTMGCTAKQASLHTLDFVTFGVSSAAGLDPYSTSDGATGMAGAVIDGVEEQRAAKRAQDAVDGKLESQNVKKEEN